jgi:L-amino acid N-acyltransferase YncA
MQIRAYKPQDAVGILAIYGPIITDSTATFELTVPNVKDFSKRLASIAGRFPFLVAVDDDQVMGYAYATTHRERVAYQWAVETSVYVAQPGNGLGKKLYQALLPQLTGRGFLWAYGVITMPNVASVTLHKACGYEGFTTYSQAGQKFGAWCDVHWMRKQLNPTSAIAHAPKFIPAESPGEHLGPLSVL